MYSCEGVIAPAGGRHTAWGADAAWTECSVLAAAEVDMCQDTVVVHSGSEMLQ